MIMTKTTANAQKEITKTWISGQNSCTLIIPRAVAVEYGLESPSHVVVERSDKGILIRKLDLDIIAKENEDQ